MASRCCILSRPNHRIYQSRIDFFLRIYPPGPGIYWFTLTSAITPPSPHPQKHNPTSLDVLLFPAHLALSSTIPSPPIAIVTLSRLMHRLAGNVSIIFPVSLDFPSNNVIYCKFSCLLCRSLFLYSLVIDIAACYYWVFP